MEVLASRKQILKKEKRDRLIIRTIFFVSVIFVVCLSIIFLYEPSKIYSVELIGNKKEQLAINTNYKDKGFTIKLNDEEINDKDIKYNVTNNIDSSTLGKYEVEYQIHYEDKDYSLKREVDVIDNVKPVISGIEDEIEVYYCNKDEDIKLDYIAEDNYDGIITDKVKVTKDNDIITLTVMDSSGNVTIKHVKVKISEEKIPRIELIGNNIVYIKQGSQYIDKGAHATDGCGSKIDDTNISVEEQVDTSTVGEYTVTYTVLSKTGLKSSRQRKVIVYDETKENIIEEGKEKVIYLTFDDGPGKYTEELLDILKKYNIKATFFVTNQFKKYVYLIKEEYENDHVVAVHTLTHKWSIYKSVETYMKDFNDMNDIIEKYTGSRSKIFRFPGGSSNTISRSYSTGVVKAISSKMSKKGYVYYDWNVDSEDALGASTSKITKNVIDGISHHQVSVVLMHDIKKNSIDAIEDIINYGLANGYTFETLNQNSPTVHHHINN